MQPTSPRRRAPQSAPRTRVLPFPPQPLTAQLFAHVRTEKPTADQIEHERRAFLEDLLRRKLILRIEPRDGRSIPVVAGELQFSQIYRDGRITGVAVRCPWCGHRHTHGAGPRPGDGNGGRASHCNDRSAVNLGYIVEEV